MHDAHSPMQQHQLESFYSFFLCLNCDKYLTSPVTRCTWCGLDLCNCCASTSSFCPRCLADRCFVSSATLDQVLTWIQLPCRHQWCFHQGLSRRMREHENRCVHRSKLCPLRHYLGCSWAGHGKNQLVRHCKIQHGEKVVVGSSQVFKLRDFKTFCGSGVKNHYFSLFDAFNELFYFYQCFDFVDGTIKWKMCFNSDKKKKKFRFQVQFDLLRIEEVTFEAPCELLREQEFHFFDFLSARFYQVVDSCNGSDLFYTVRIQSV